MSTLLFLSGASRGLGRAIAVEFSKASQLQDMPLRAILLARSKDGLNETEIAMRDNHSTIDASKHAIDLSNLEKLETSVEPIFPQEHPWKRSILINCAGTTGYIGADPSLKDIQEACNLNFTSKVWLSSRFASLYGSSSDDCVIVNISSMCAIKPTPTMALYSATSAARDMFHAVLSRDICLSGSTNNNNNNNNTRVLNYAPGSCDTDMQAMLRVHDRLDTEVQAYCRSLVDSGGLVKTEDTAKELVQRVLNPNGFQSGERVEYSDICAYKY